MDRHAAIALLEATHTFPGDHTFRAIVRGEPSAVDAVLTSVASFRGESPRVEQVSSSGGRWISLRITVSCPSAAHVLDVYAHLQALPEVVKVI